MWTIDMKCQILLITLLCCMIVIPLAHSETTLLNEQVDLNSDHASQSYSLHQGSGDSISILLTVSGEGLIDFHILNSTDGQLMDKYDVSTEGLQEQWTAPYSDDFEFIVELAALSAASEATVSLKVTSGESANQNGGVLVDQNVTLNYDDMGQDFYLNLTAGEKISIQVSATGSKVFFEIYNGTIDRIFAKANLTSMDEEWTAPKQDTYDFFIYNLEGTAQAHITLAKVGATGGGFDPTLLIVVAVVVAIVLVGSLVALRVRKGRLAAAPPPPPPPPPPPS
jgi:hypothetical protein